MTDAWIVDARSDRARPTTRRASASMTAVSVGRGSCRAYSSSTAWKFVPPKPKALTPARRGWWPVGLEPGPRLGVHVERTVGEVAPSGSAGSTPSVGGSTRWCSASATLISPATPAVALVWPIIDLTEPIAQLLARRRRLAEEGASAPATSAWSPATVPVPWASISPTSGRREAGLCVGPPQGPHLALGPRGGQAPVAAVAGAADARG